MRLMTIRDAWRASTRAALLVLISAVPAASQASLQVPLQFDFMNPGARSLGLGGAFVGLADDATSSFNNPAGLINLPDHLEVSVEFRGRQLETPFLQSGRLSGSLTNTGIDTVQGPQYGSSGAASAGAAFLSVVSKGTRVRFAAYRHEIVRLDQDFTALGVFQGPSRELALKADRNLSLTAYGATLGYEVRPGRLSVGGSVALYSFDLDARFSRFFSNDLHGMPSFDAREEIGRATQNGSGARAGFSAGLLFSPYANDQATGIDLVRVGLVYRQAPRFDYDGVDGDLRQPDARTGTFNVPDSVGAGIVIRRARTAVFTADVVRVDYAALQNGYVDVQTEALIDEGLAELRSNFKLDSGTEAHAGFEYTFPALRGAPRLRIGAWRDPDHSVRYDPGSTGHPLDERFAAYLPARGPRWHTTFGGGFSFGRVEVNGAADLARDTRTISISSVLRIK
jgi:long-chain fatty acid transport protein